MTNARSSANSINKRMALGTVCGVVLASFLILGFSGHQAELTRAARAEEREKGLRCSDHTLAGRYATRGDGFVPSGPAPAPMVPFAEVGLMTLDGSGNLTHDVTTSNNGLILRDIDHGSYSVNEDCKGTMTINIPVPPFQLNFDLVVAQRGKEFELIATTPSVVTNVGKRLE